MTACSNTLEVTQENIVGKNAGEDERENINNDAANHMASQTFEGETTIIVPTMYFQSAI